MKLSCVGVVTKVAVAKPIMHNNYCQVFDSYYLGKFTFMAHQLFSRQLIYVSFQDTTDASQ